MFNNLTDKLHDALRKLRGVASLTEANISEAMQDVRTALLDADVNREVAEWFIGEVRKECLGSDVVRSITPGQMAVKIVNDKLTELMGPAEAPMNFEPARHPNVAMLVGLHGSGKTTTTAKLALHMSKHGQKPLMAACDVYRPAAIDQLEILGVETGIPVHSERGNMDVCAIASAAIEKARTAGNNYVLLDTAGRLQIDTDMVQELVRLKETVRPQEIFLVADAALGQQAVSVASHFHEALGITGIILTKLDGDARGGAALSIKKVTGCPVKFMGVGEKLEELEIFHPDRMASRILGMGDIVSLVERAAEEIDRAEAEKLQEKLKKNDFDFEDFLSQLRQMSRLGGIESILKLLPGGNQLAGMGELDPSNFRRMEAIICSMTKKERANPEMLDMSRRKRIARGSGTKVEEVSQLIKQFVNMRKMMKSNGILGKLMSSGTMPSAFGGMGGMGGLGGMGGMGGFRSSFSRGSNFTPKKKKRKKK